MQSKVGLVSPYVDSFMGVDVSALVDLNGRFFGGREVCASFYKIEDFHNNVLDK